MNNSCSVVKAYGKVLVYGGYSVLEGGTGLVVNVDKGTTTKASFSDETEIIVAHIKDKDKLRFAESAVKAARGFLKSDTELKIESRNDEEMNPGSKAGFGSSATSTVSIVASILNLHGVDVVSEEGRRTVFQLSKEAHTEAQGKIGSGFDISAACFGTQFFSKDKIEKAAWPDDWRAVFAFSGKSASTTEFVKRVFGFKEANPEEYSRIMDEYNKTGLEIKSLYEEYVKESNDENLKALMQSIGKSYKIRKNLGVKANVEIETDDDTELLSGIRREGAMVAALPGAGGGDSLFMVCEGEENMKKIKEHLRQKELKVFDNIRVVDKPYEVLA